MRGFRSTLSVSARTALYQTLRWRLTEHEDTLLTESLRNILRRHGALPLPRVTALFSDDVLEVMSNVDGGLRCYLQERPSQYHVELLPSGVRVVMLASMLRSANTAIPLVAQVLAHLAVSPQQQMTIPQLFRALSALEQRRCGSEQYLEAFLQQHPSLLIVHNGIVKAAPTAFAQRRGITTVPPTPSPPPTQSGRFMKSQGPPPEPPVSSRTVMEDAKMNKLLAFLRGVVPLSYYVPLSFATQQSRSYMCFSHGISLEGILEELQRVPANVLDCRVIGDEKDDVFLRMMDAELRPYVNDESRVSSKYEVLQLGAPLIEAFRTFAAQGPERRKRLQSGIAMADLKDVIPSELLNRLHHLYNSTQKDAACIFVFDRLRHLFDVNMTAYMVRPWEVLAAHAQPSSLTWQTTPIPVVLRHCLLALNDKPLAPDALLKTLPPGLQRQLQLAYPSVADFAAHHSLYLFVKDGLVWTPYLAAASQGARVPTSARGVAPGRHLTDALKARMLMEVMPLNHPVNWHRFRLHSLTRELPFETCHFRPEFFERHRECFRVYEPLGTTTLIVGRRDGIPPPGHLLQPPCNSLNDLVRQMALFSIGGAQESTIMNHLSKEARQMVRRYGSLQQIAVQLPMWFDVRSEGGQHGSGIISYIATEGRDA